MKLTRTTILAAGIALAMSAALFAACGGDDDDGDDNGDNGDNTPVATRTAASAGDDTPEPAPTDDAPPGDPGDDGDVAEIKELAGKFVQATFTANYELTGAPGESLAQGTITLTKRGSERFRFDLTSSEGQLIFIQTPDITASCLTDASLLGVEFDIPEGEGVCFEQALGGQGLGNFAEDFQAFVDGDVAVLETSERTIVGETVKCYLTREENEEVTNVCINNDGILLAVESPDGSRLEASDFSTDVDDGEFELPWEIRELPTGEDG